MSREELLVILRREDALWQVAEAQVLRVLGEQPLALLFDDLVAQLGETLLGRRECARCERRCE